MISLPWFGMPSDLFAFKRPMPAFVITVAYEGPFEMCAEPSEPFDASEAAPLDLGQEALVNAKVFKVQVGADYYTTVLLCRIKDGVTQWGIYCHDDAVNAERVGGVTRIGRGKQLAAALRKEGTVSMKACNALEAERWVGILPESSTCSFWPQLRRSHGKKFCSHVEATLDFIENEMSEADGSAILYEMEEELRGWLDGGAEDGSGAVDDNMSAEEIAFYDAAFIQHVMLAGERGSGKTFLARQAADRLGAAYLEIQMHPSMEPWELRAHDRAWDGKVYTVLGKLAEAVYLIKEKGRKVVLCMDEFMNMNPVYQTTINSPLSLTDRDTYIIETGRIIDQGNGIGTVETVEVPSDMLWVVATSNVGARYGLDKIAPSVRARFQIILMNTDADRTKTILKKNLAKYNMPEELAGMFHSFISKTSQAVQENTMDEEATTRLACNVIRAVKLRATRAKKAPRSLKGWLPLVKEQMQRERFQVVNFELGTGDETQEDLYSRLVDSCFRV